MKKVEIKTELESQILACMLSEPQNIPFIYQRVKSNDFSEINRELFEGLSEINYSTNPNRDLIILDLAGKGLKNWTFKNLFDLMNRDISLESLVFNQVIERFSDILFSFKAESLLHSKLLQAKESINGIDILSDLQSDIQTELSTLSNFKEEKSFSENLPIIAGQIEDEIAGSSSDSLELTNIPSFNNATGGMRASNLIGIAGSYKSGKTTLALNIVMDLVKQNIPCGFFSLELSETELNRKILASISGVQYEKLRSPKKLDASEKQKLTETFKVNLSKKDFPLYASDKRLSEIELKNKAKYWRDRFGIRVIAIDYIGYLRSKKKFDLRERELSYYSEFLKGLAKELNLIVLVVAQLNRVGRINPGVENLAESIALARDCDFFFTIHNPKQIGIKNDGRGFQFEDNHFVCKMDTSRHTRSRGSFVLSLSNCGTFSEVATEFDNNYSASAAAFEDVI